MANNSSFDRLANRLPPPNYGASFRAPEDLAIVGGTGNRNGAPGSSCRPASASTRRDRESLQKHSKSNWPPMDVHGACMNMSASNIRGEESASVRPATACGAQAAYGSALVAANGGVGNLGARRDPPAARVDPKNFLRKGTARSGRHALDTQDRSRPLLSAPHVPSGGTSEVLVQRGGSSATGTARPAPARRRTRFSKMFDGGDLPVKWAHEGAANSIRWSTPLCALDSQHLTSLVPVFFEGLQEAAEKHRFVAVRGSMDLVGEACERGLGPELVLLVLPTARQALALRHCQVAGDVLSLMIIMLHYPGVGKALTPQLRWLLTSCLALSRKHSMVVVGANTNKKTEFRDVLWKFLEMCENKGGEKAYKIIKGCIPDYMRTRKKCTALLVEPEVINQKDGTSVLKRLGYEVMVTGLLQDALQVAQQQGTLNLLVIDAGPRVDGVRILEELRDAGFNPKAVALSLAPNSMQRDEYLDSGFSAYLSRPLDARRLEAALLASELDRHSLGA